MYTLQPPEAIVCNPYQNGILNLTCAVTGQLVDGIHWYFRPAGSSQSVLMSNGSQVTLRDSEFEGNYAVVLTITGLNLENEGIYWCQGLVQSDNSTLKLSQSHEFELLAENMYIFLSHCPLDKALKNAKTRCAVIIPTSTGPPVSTSTAHPSTSADLPLPSSTMNSHLSTQSTVSVFQHVGSTTTQHVNSIRSTPSPTSQVITSSPSKTPNPVSSPDTPANDVHLSDIILYAILALLGCLVLVVLLLSVLTSLLCCKRRRHQLEGNAIFNMCI